MFRSPLHRVSHASGLLHLFSILLQLFMMMAFYHDSSRKSVFAERARQLGPLSGPEMCPIDLLEWSPGMSMSPYQEIDVGKIRSVPCAHLRLREYDYHHRAVDRDPCPSSRYQSSASRANYV